MLTSIERILGLCGHMLHVNCFILWTNSVQQNRITFNHDKKNKYRLKTIIHIRFQHQKEEQNL